MLPSDRSVSFNPRPREGGDPREPNLAGCNELEPRSREPGPPPRTSGGRRDKGARKYLVFKDLRLSRASP